MEGRWFLNVTRIVRISCFGLRIHMQVIRMKMVRRPLIPVQGLLFIAAMLSFYMTMVHAEENDTKGWRKNKL